MPILLLSENFPPKTGGSGRWFWETYRRLPREEVAIAAGEDARQDEFDTTHDLSLVRVPLSMPSWGVASWAGLKGYWRAVREVCKIVRRLRPAVIHTGRCLPEGVVGMAVKCLTNTPYVCYVHGEDVNMAWSSRELALLVRCALRGAEYCIANSQNTASLLMRDWGISRQHVKILHPGVDTQRFAPADRCAMTRRGLGWRERPVILTVGRLQRRKGQDMLIRALPKVREAFPDVLYSIIGSGQEEAALIQLVRQLRLEQNVEFRGEATDEEMARCYQQCDLFALPNREIEGDIEGFGMVLLEAQACGRPVLAGASGGTAETMIPGETGVVVDCTSPEPLAMAVAELLADENRLEKMGRAGRQWVVERFDWSALATEAAEHFGIEMNTSALDLPPAAHVAC